MIKVLKKYSGIFIKIIALICFIVAIITIHIARNSPATGYEASIIHSTPSIVWASLILSILCGNIIIVYQIYTRNYRNNNLLIGFILIFFSYATIISLYIIRGYYMWSISGDPAAHLGIVQKIIVDGNIGNTNFYPILHIYATIILLISNVDIIPLYKLLPFLFGILYIPFMYILMKSILVTKEQIVLGTLFSCTLVNGWYLNFTPNHLSNLFFPVVLYILVNVFIVDNTKWRILLLIMVFLYPPFHQVPTIFLIVFLMTVWLPKKIFISNSNSQKDNNISKYKATLLFIILVWGITWISNFFVWEHAIQNIYQVFTESGTTHASEMTDKLAYAEGYAFNVFDYLFKTMTGTFIYFIIAIICFPIIWKEIHLNKQYFNLFTLYSPLFVMFLLIILSFFSHLLFGPLRMLFYLILICSIFAGFGIHRVIEVLRDVGPSRVSILYLGMLVILLMSLFVSGMLNLYPSSYIYMSNAQTTHMEVSGMSWIFHNADLNKGLSGISSSFKRFENILLVSETEKKQIKVLRSPYHFGYNNYSSASASYNENVYLVTTQKDKSMYVDLFPTMAEIRWIPSDFGRLQKDIGVDKFYSNGEFDVWYVHALKSVGFL